MEDPLMESDMYTLWLGVGPSPPQVSDAIAHWAGKTREEALDRAEVELEAVLSERALAGSPTA
jgi:predicted RNase H-like HicB family nuclease